MANNKESVQLVLQDAAAVAEAAAQRFVALLLEPQNDGALRHIALTGGTEGIALLKRVRSNRLADQIDWSRVHLWWGDDRFVPVADPDRNARQAAEALLDHIQIDKANIHPIPPLSEQVPTPEVSADLYAAELARFAEPQGRTPRFDLVFLGLGPDAHVASMFPGFPQLESVGVAEAVHDSPKPPPLRVTLTVPTLNNSDRVWFVTAGEHKAAAVAKALAQDSAAPAAHIHPLGQTLWFLDTAAAGLTH